MSHWNYRIVKYKDGSGYGLHEVYYNGDQAISMTLGPIDFTVGPDDHPDEITIALHTALKDAKTKPVLEEPAEWPGVEGDE